MSYEPKFLEMWTLPSNYGGATYPDYYCTGVGRSRDSDMREESNFDATLKALREIPGADGEATDGSPYIEVTSASHWAVGWVEGILVHKGFAAGLKAADEIAAALADYPVLDDSDLSEREHEAICSEWEHMRLKDRIRLCAGERVSVFAARREEIPERVYQRLSDRLY